MSMRVAQAIVAKDLRTEVRSRSGPSAKPNASSIVAANGRTVLTADRLRTSVRRSLATIA